MTLNLSLSRPAEVRLKRRAAAAGKNPAEYARALIEREMLAGESFDEILRPIRKRFQESGTTEGQLDHLVKRARRAVSRSNGRRGKQSDYPSVAGS